MQGDKAGRQGRSGSEGGDHRETRPAAKAAIMQGDKAGRQGDKAAAAAKAAIIGRQGQQRRLRSCRETRLGEGWETRPQRQRRRRS